MRKELPKFFEYIVNITKLGYKVKIEQQGDTIKIYANCGFCLLLLVILVLLQFNYPLFS